MNLYLNFYSFFFFEIQDLISVRALCLLYLPNVPKTILTSDISFKFRDPQAHLQL